MTSAQQLWAIALGELGVREVPGKRSNKRIREYYEAAGLVGDEPGEPGYDDSTTPWCGCFVAWVANQAGFTAPKRAAAARSWLNFGLPTDFPSPGHIVVLSRGPNPAHGHVGLYAGHTLLSRKIAVLGGNQGNRVSVALYDADRLLGFRIPDASRVK